MTTLANDAAPVVVTVIVLLLALIVFGIVIASVNGAKAREEAAKKRRETIYAKYGQTEEAERILRQNIWHGETAEQLTDSLGPPVDVDQKVLKTKKKEIWKYAHRGGNRFGLRITLDNDVVVGWDEKL